MNRTYLAIFLVFTSIILSLVLLVLYHLHKFNLSSSQDLNKIKNKICLSKECIRSAAFLLDRIDFNVNPCENFYEFSCGKFLNSKSVPDDRTSRNVIQEIQDEILVEIKNYLEDQKFVDYLDELNLNPNLKEKLELDSINKTKIFYRSCINESLINDETTSINVILNLIYKFGGNWNLLNEVSTRNETIKEKFTSYKCIYEFDKIVSNKNVILEKRIFSTFLHQIQPLFYFYIAPEELKPTSNKYAIHLYSGSTILESNHLINNLQVTNQANLNYREIYSYLQLEVITKLAKLKGNSINISKALNLIDKMIDFEYDLAIINKQFNVNSSLSNEDKIEINFENKSQDLLNANDRKFTTYFHLDIAILQQNYGFINWRMLFGLMESYSRQKIEKVLIENPKFLVNIAKLFQKYNSITIDNYLCWSTIAHFLPYLGSNFKYLFSEFKHKLSDLQPDNNNQAYQNLFQFNRFDYSKKRKKNSPFPGRLFLSRWKECVYLTSEKLKKPTLLLYLEKHKDHVEKITIEVTNMINTIKKAFYEIIDNQSWLINDHIKQIIKERAKSIKSKIVFTKHLENLKKTDYEYKNLDINLEDVFIENIIKLVRHEMINELQLLNQKLDSNNDWMIEPLIPNAYYDSINHFIILPVAILRHPFISLNRPKYLDFATLGAIIGHEIAHAFDSVARTELNKNLNSIENSSLNNNPNLNWWPEILNKEYEIKSQCFANKFNNYSINGNLTLEENICDFAGFQQAFTAYKLSKTEFEEFLLPGLNELNPDQLFFVQYAQVLCEIFKKDSNNKPFQDSHAPGKFRANGVASNSKQYLKIFNCKPNQPMNFEQKCDLWTF